MKNIITFILILVLGAVSNNSFAANSKETHYTGRKVIYSTDTEASYYVHHDGSSGSYIIHSPAADKAVCIKRVDFKVSADTEIDWYWESVKFFDQDMLSGEGFSQLDWKCGPVGDDLKVDSDAAVDIPIDVREQYPVAK